MTEHLWRILLAGMLALALLPAGADQAEAAGSWSAWLYRQDSGQLVQIRSDGGAGYALAFPLPAGYTDIPYEIALSPSGARLAACLTDAAGTVSVKVYDLPTGAWIGSYTAPGVNTACHVGRASFSADESQIAFGILNHWRDELDVRPDWEVLVMDVATSFIRYRLTSEDASILALGYDWGGARPTITAFATGVVAFAPVWWATEGAEEYDSVVWQLDSGFVGVLGPYGKASLDYQTPSGEAIWIEARSDFPLGVIEGMGYPYNAVMYSNKAGAWHPIFHRSGAVIDRALFIEDGYRVAVRSTLAPNPATWSFVNRSGGTGALTIPSNVVDVWGVPDGYVYLDPAAAPSGRPTLVYHRFNGGVLQAFTLWTGDPGAYWSILAVTPPPSTAGLPPFPAVSAGAPGVVLANPPVLMTLPPQVFLTPLVTLVAPGLQFNPALIGTPVVIPSPVVITTPTPGPLALRPGGTAVVSTTAGDGLRVRSGPGTEFSVLFVLANTTPVSVLEGPMAGGNYTWWRIQTADGRSGWAVEGVPEGSNWLQTLTPTG